MKRLILLAAALGCVPPESGPHQPTPEGYRITADHSDSIHWERSPFTAIQRNDKPVAVVLGITVVNQFEALPEDIKQSYTFCQVDLSEHLRDGRSVRSLWEGQLGRQIEPPELMLFSPGKKTAEKVNGVYSRPLPILTSSLENILRSLL